MMSEIVSIIIPVYNVEALLSRCLDSVCEQTYPHLEIICVNDGSPDRCDEILATYQQKDSRIQVINQENQGLAGARNAGLDQASGIYVMFVDSDDLIHPQMVELGVAIAERYQAPIVANWKPIGFKGTPPQTLSLDIDHVEVLRRDNPLSTLLSKSYSASACSRLFRRDLIADLRFVPGITFEDWPFTTCLFAKVDFYMRTNIPIYFYEEGNVSITRSAFSLKKVKDYIAGIDFVYDFFKQEAYTHLWPTVRKLRIRTTLKMLVSKVSHTKGALRKELLAVLLPELIRLHEKGAFRYRELTFKTIVRIAYLKVTFRP